MPLRERRERRGPGGGCVPLAVILTTLAAACAGGGQGGPESTAPAELRARVVAVLASRPQDMTGTARYAARTFLLDDSGNNKRVTSLEGQADFGQQRYSATVTLYRPEDGQPAATMQYFILGQEIYELLPVGWRQGTKPPGEIGSPLALAPLLGHFHDGGGPAYADDPAARRKLVDGLVSSVEPMGRERLRGEEADRYRVSVDVNRARSTVDGSLVEQMLRWESPGSGTLDVWITDDRLRQFTSIATSDQQAFVRWEQEYWDYGGVPPLAIPEGVRP